MKKNKFLDRFLEDYIVSDCREEAKKELYKFFNFIYKMAILNALGSLFLGLLLGWLS